jgi:hypothetical protein
VVDTAQVIYQLVSKLDAGGGHRRIGLDVGQPRGRLFRIDLVGNTASDQVAQHRVQSTGDLSAGARQVAVTARPQLHHRGVVLAADLLRCR